MHLQEIFYLTLTQGQGHLKHCRLYHLTYVPAKFEVATANGQGDAFARKYIISPLTLTLDQGQTPNVADYRVKGLIKGIQMMIGIF